MDDAHDSPTNDPVDPNHQTLTNPVIGDSPDLSLQRIHDYLRESLARVNAFAANLGAVNSGLMLIAYRIQKAIEAEMEPGPATLDELAYFMPAIDNLLKITKQIGSFSQLDMKLDELKTAKLAAIADVA